MPLKYAARYPKPDSIAANPNASRLLTSIVSSGIVQPGDDARKWYSYLSHITPFSPVSAQNLGSDLCNYSMRRMEIKQNLS